MVPVSCPMVPVSCPWSRTEAVAIPVDKWQLSRHDLDQSVTTKRDRERSLLLWRSSLIKQMPTDWYCHCIKSIHRKYTLNTSSARPRSLPPFPKALSAPWPATCWIILPLARHLKRFDTHGLYNAIQLYSIIPSFQRSKCTRQNIENAEQLRVKQCSRLLHSNCLGLGLNLYSLVTSQALCPMAVIDESNT